MRARLAPKDVTRFQKRLSRLPRTSTGSALPDGDLHVLTFALFRASTDLPPPADDA